MDKVCVVIVNYRGWKDTIECIESVLKQNHVHFQIIVVDNSEDYTSFDKIKTWATFGEPVETEFPEWIIPIEPKPFNDFVAVTQDQFDSARYNQKLILVKAKGNDGFAAANNIGLKYVLRNDDFSYTWLLNNDTVVPPSCLKAMLDLMNSDKQSKTGILGAKVLEYHNRNMIQSAGGGKMIRSVAYSYLIGGGEQDKGQYDVSNLDMDFVAGTSMLVRKSFLKEVGLLNEEYFLYFEEPDWAERAARLKWKMVYCFRANVYHKGGASTGGKGYSSEVKSSTPFSDFYFQRAKVLYTRNHNVLWLPLVYLSFGMVVLNRLRRKQFSRVKDLLSILVHPSRRYISKP